MLKPKKMKKLSDNSFKMRQILEKNFNQTDFELEKKQRISFWAKIFHHLGFWKKIAFI